MPIRYTIQQDKFDKSWSVIAYTGVVYVWGESHWRAVLISDRLNDPAWERRRTRTRYVRLAKEQS